MTDKKKQIVNISIYNYKDKNIIELFLSFKQNTPNIINEYSKPNLYFAHK